MPALNENTIYAPATVPGTGAISIIRISGPEAFPIADKVVTCRRGKIADAAGYTVLFGTVPTKDGKVLDEVLVSVFRAPHSYTGEDSVEISCHASSYIVSELMSMLALAGARAAAPGEFTQRAFINGKMDLAQAEAVADVIASQNAAAHRIAFNQMKGGFSSELKSMRAELLEMVSLMELELDFSEEDVEFADRTHLIALLDRTMAHIGRLAASFRLGNAIKNGIPVAIVGATNAGKSTLLNALLGEERAIVSDVHGTTRDTIEETLNIDGVLFRFIDTAGLRETSDIVEKIGIERSYGKLHSASIVIGMIDGTASEELMRKSAEEIVSKINPDEQKLWLLVNKCDLSGEDFSLNKIVTNLNSIVSSVVNHSVEIIRISAKSGQGIERLKTSLASSQKDLIADQSATLVTNLRHYEALVSASASLGRAKEGLSASIPTDLVAQDIRESLYTLGSILGEISSDEVLGNIFRNFCVGK